MSEKIYENVSCTRCGGSGIYRWGTFAGEAHGTCFKCDGAGTQRRRVYTPEQIAAREARALKKAQAEEEKVRAEFAAREEELRIAREAREAEAARFEFLPASVGDAIEFSGKVVFTKVVESNYGSSLLVILREGVHEVKMFTTANWAWGVDKGDDVTIRATVKELSEYEGKKTTVVTRAKAI